MAWEFFGTALRICSDARKRDGLDFSWRRPRHQRMAALFSGDDADQNAVGRIARQYCRQCSVVEKETMAELFVDSTAAFLLRVVFVQRADRTSLCSCLLSVPYSRDGARSCNVDEPGVGRGRGAVALAGRRNDLDSSELFCRISTN